MKAVCKELKSFLEEKKPITFDCVGGCGIDTSLGTRECMNDYGVWFKFCPFCGKKIVSKFSNGFWDWWEE
jgi:hypothetical protein